MLRFHSTDAPVRRVVRHRQWLLISLLGLAIGTVYQQYHRQPPYQLRVFSTAAGWGYAVSTNGTTLIYQPNVPGRVGSAGFANEAQARRVGERVIEKLGQGSSLPTLRADELRQLGVPAP